MEPNKSKLRMLNNLTQGKYNKNLKSYVEFQNCGKIEMRVMFCFLISFHFHAFFIVFYEIFSELYPENKGRGIERYSAWQLVDMVTC